MFIAPSDLKVKSMPIPIIPIVAGASAAAGAFASKRANKLKDSRFGNYNVFSSDLSKHGQAYQDLASANPYANVSYRQSWIQKLLEGLGFRTNKDAYLESMALQAQEYDNQILQKEYNENYDSPLEQVKREREAGLNPDLTGNISAGESQSPVDDGNPPIAPEADDLNKVVGFATTCLQGVQFAFGMAKDLQSLRSMRLDNLSKEDNFVVDSLLKILPDVYENRSGTDWTSVDSYYNQFKQAYGKVMSKKQFERFYQRAVAFQNGLAVSDKEWTLRDSRSGKRNSFFKRVTRPDYSEADEVMQVVSESVSDLAFSVEYNSQSYLNEKAKKDLEYERYRNGQTEGIQHNRGLILDNEGKQISNDVRSLEKEQLEYKRALRGSFENVIKRLSKLEESGNSFASVAKMVLSTMLLKYIGD